MKTIRPALVIFIIFSVATGLIYPALVTGVSRALFPYASQGSIITSGGVSVGSELIGQQFSTPGRFWGRLSATSPVPYAADNSTGSNLGPTNPALVDAVKGRIDALISADPAAKGRPIPVELVTASGSGLDPHISPAAVYYQVGRVARVRNLPEATVKALVDRFIEGRAFGILGEPKINVLLLNMALDKLK